MPSFFDESKVVLQEQFLSPELMLSDGPRRIDGEEAGEEVIIPQVLL